MKPSDLADHPKAVAADERSRPDAIAKELASIAEKLERQEVEWDRTLNARRKRMVGERIAHLKAKRASLLDEQFR